jgi:hypothetical protein
VKAPEIEGCSCRPNHSRGRALTWGRAPVRPTAVDLARRAGVARDLRLARASSPGHREGGPVHRRDLHRVGSSAAHAQRARVRSRATRRSREAIARHRSAPRRRPPSCPKTKCTRSRSSRRRGGCGGDRQTADAPRTRTTPPPTGRRRSVVGPSRGHRAHDPGRPDALRARCAEQACTVHCTDESEG